MKRKRSQTPPTTLPSEASTYSLHSEGPSMTLPDELLDIIVRLACKRSDDDPASPETDIKTMHSFALVSKALYNLVIPFLYIHVRLNKPSDLLLYARTVSIQPSLASYTKTLWIGPDANHVEGEDCWPLNDECTAIKSSITKPMDLPHGVEVGFWWFFASEDSEDEVWIEGAARDIVRKACKTVGDSKLRHGVSLESGGKRSHNGKKLEPIEGHLRVYQVQQLLDAFLLGVRKKQDSGLSLQRSSSTPLRWYSLYDRFDHPVIYDRSQSAPTRARKDWESLQRAVVFDDLDYDVLIIDGSDNTDAWEVSSDSEQDEWLDDSVLNIYANNGAEFDLNLAKIVCGEVASGKPTLGGLILLARIIFARSDSLLCLALTSYLQMAVYGHDFGPRLDHLHLLMVGPPARRYQVPISLNHQGLGSVRQLRLWESAPSEAVFQTVESRQALPALEDLECTWSAPWDNSFDQEWAQMSTWESDAASASLTLLACSDIRKSAQPSKSIKLSVSAHHSRMDESDAWDLAQVTFDPSIELKTLPWDVAEFEGCEHSQRPKALACIRKQWERECQEVLALPEEKLVVMRPATQKKCRESSVEFYEGLRVIEEGDSDGPF